MQYILTDAVIKDTDQKYKSVELGDQLSLEPLQYLHGSTLVSPWIQYNAYAEALHAFILVLSHLGLSLREIHTWDPF